MSAPSFYEVRCENCRTSVPPETRRCIHCGGAIGSSGLSRLAAARGLPVDVDAEDEEGVGPSRARNILWLVTAAIAIVMSALRTCTPS
jgi:hypothetical protein